MKKLFTLFLLLFAVSMAAFSQTQNTITTDSVYQTGPCAGSQIIVRFSTTGTFPVFGNTFTAQLSNAWGQFNNPVNIGSTNFNFGIMMATLPANATFGFLYRVRVVSSNPAVVGTPSLNTVIITSNQFTATILPQGGTTTICPGASKTLQVALQANSYQWSTGETTQAITITQPGTYWVRVTDFTTCESRDTVTITAGGNCTPLSAADLLPETEVSIYPNPVSAKGSLTLQGWQPGLWREVQLIDVSGKAVARTISSTPEISLAPYSLAAGLYQLVLTAENQQRKTFRVMVSE